MGVIVKRVLRFKHDVWIFQHQYDSDLRVVFRKCLLIIDCRTYLQNK